MASKRGYVVLRDVTADDDSDDRWWEEFVRGEFQSGEQALDAAADKLGPRSGDDHEGRTFVAVPTSYFKPRTEREEIKRERKWSDA